MPTSVRGACRAVSVRVRELQLGRSRIAGNLVAFLAVEERTLHHFHPTEGGQVVAGERLRVDGAATNNPSINRGGICRGSFDRRACNVTSRVQRRIQRGNPQRTVAFFRLGDRTANHNIRTARQGTKTRRDRLPGAATHNHRSTQRHLLEVRQILRSVPGHIPVTADNTGISLCPNSAQTIHHASSLPAVRPQSGRQYRGGACNPPAQSLHTRNRK